MNMKFARAVVGLLGSAMLASGALEEVSDFGENPSTIQMFIYVPSELPANPPVVVAASNPILVPDGGSHRTRVFLCSG